MLNISSKTYSLILYLVCCTMNGKKADPAMLSGLDADDLMEQAEAHSLAAVIAEALGSALNDRSLFSEAQARDWEEKRNQTIRTNMLFNAERQNVLALLENNKVWHMPLKGYIISNYYPNPLLRRCSDVDVLFDPEKAELVRDLMNTNGYKTEDFNGNDEDIYFKQPVYNFEMHRALVDNKQEVWYDYYKNVKQDRLERVEGKEYEYRFNDNDFYVYFVVHAVKHIRYSGTGLRTLVDLYVCINKSNIDFAYIEGEFKKLGVYDEEQLMRKLSVKLFSESALNGQVKLTQEEADLLDRMIISGVYGTEDLYIENNFKKISGDKEGSSKLKYAMYRLFPPAELYRKTYPFFYKHKAARPFLVFVRGFDIITKRRKNLINEINLVKKM